MHWCFVPFSEQNDELPYKELQVKQSLYRAIADLEGAWRLRLPDFKTIGTCR
jgi:hypothetical protein